MSLFYTPDDYNPYNDMTDEERVKYGCMSAVVYLALLILGFVMCALFGSCTTTKYVAVPQQHTDTLRITQTQRDSIYQHDSIYIRDHGDTVKIERWHTQYRDRWQHDTIYKSRVDSVQVLVPADSAGEPQNTLTWWQQTRIHIADIVLWMLLLTGTVWMIRRKI